jgi:1-acyl-sn-glycerol-3-phosphate acyltransferase
VTDAREGSTAAERDPGAALELVRSLALWIAIAVMTIVYFPIDLVGSLLLYDRTHRFGHWFARFWAKSIIRLNSGWRIEMDLRRLPADRHFVIASNHESTADIIVDLHMPHHFKFISKSTNFVVPFMGWAMYVAGYIPLVRGRRSSIEQCMERSRWYLRNGVSVLFYPEGTRSPDGNVRPFKAGAFRLAIETCVDVLPVVTLGRELLKKNSLLFKAGTMRLIVGDPIPVAGLTLRDVDALAQRTREAIVALKAEIAQEPSETLRKAS